MSVESPNFFLYAQHGWADDNREIAALASSLATSKIRVIAPRLGYIQTWIRIEPLIRVVEEIAIATTTAYPNTPIKIIAHSMGELIWLEVLNRHPEWWPLVHSLVLLASPVGGADLGRILDPFSIGIGIAQGLGKNRRPIAEKIAAFVPTLVIAGDIDGGGDGTITVGSTKIRHAQFIRLLGLSHPVLRNHPLVVAAIRGFWARAGELEENIKHTDFDLNEVIQRLESVPGMTDAHQRDFYRAKVFMTLKDGTSIRTWKNPLGVDHIFIASPQGQYLYGGFVGWVHAEDLLQALKEIKQKYSAL